jgi:D-alanyl-D-alanine dipeptidase
MLAARQGSPLPALPMTTPVDTARARQLAGRWAHIAPREQARYRRDGLRGDEGVRYVDLRDRAGELFFHDDGRYALRALADTLIVDDRRAFGTRLIPLDSGRLLLGRDTLIRVPAARPAPPPARWAGLIGEYGWDHDVLYILEQDGKLVALIEWFFQYPLEEVGPDVFRFPARGLYDGEYLRFTRAPDGRATQVEAAGVVFNRRSIGGEPGATFRITPVRPVDALRAEALAASPPAENGDFRASDLVELRSLDHAIRYDIRYATSNNFMGEVFYTQPHAFLQRPAAWAVARADSALHASGYGLLIHDAYRPWYVTRMFWDATPADMKQFVADPARGSRHNRGAAVDLTLYALTDGRPADMVSGYDEFSPRAYPEYPGGTALQRWHRELLRSAMEARGFNVYEFEWWHFDFADWRHYRIGNQRFEELGR